MRSKLQVFAIISAVLCIAVGLAACGSDSDSSSTDSSGGGGSETSETSEASGGSGAQEEAAKLVDKWEKRPTKIPATEPLSKPVPKGKSWAYLNCGVPECNDYEPYMEAAAEALGWSYKTFRTTPEPQAITDTAKEVVKADPDGFTQVAIAGALMGPYYEELSENGTVNVPCCVLEGAGGPVDFVIGGKEHGEYAGKQIADFIVAEKGEDANIVWFSSKDFEILGAYGEGVKNELARLCPSCGYDEINVASSELGKPTVGTKVVSYLRTHPDVNYVVPGFCALATGLPSAIQAAGLDEVSMAATSANPECLAEIQEGTGLYKAGVIFGAEYGIWAMDIAMRQMIGDPLPTNTLSAEWLITNKNAPDDITENPPLVANALEQYEELWGLK